MATDLEHIITSWKMQYGKEWKDFYGTVYYVVPGGPPQRREMLRYLIHTMIDTLGFTEDDFTKMIKDEIIRSCVYDKNMSSKEKQKWHSSIATDLSYVLAEKFAQQFVKQEINIENKSKEIIEAAGTDRTLYPREKKKYQEWPDEEEEIEINLLDLSKIPKVERDFDLETPEELLARLEGTNVRE